jgi:putative MATE family efflux protein
MRKVKDLTQGAIGRQLIFLALPIMGTSFIQMAYSLTDIAWIGRIGSQAVAAIGAVSMLNWLATTFSWNNKVGAEVLVAQSIGLRNESQARTYASQNTTMSLLLSLLVALLLGLGAPHITPLFGLDVEITAIATRYLRIVCLGFPFYFLSLTFTGVYNAAGLSKIPFYISGAGLLLNMLLDPFCIFVLDWKTEGAAIATVLSQMTVFFLFLYQMRIKDRLLGNFRWWVRLKKKHTQQILKVGGPVSLLNMLFCFASLFLGRLAAQTGGHIALLCLTTGAQIEALTWNTSQGLSTALSTFVAQNYAARALDRVMKGFYFIARLGFVIGWVSTFLFMGVGEHIFALFVPEKAAYTAGGTYLFILAFSQLFMLLEITMQGMFYGLGRTIPPALTSVTFNYMRIPLSLLFIAWGLGVNGIWWAISVSSIIKGLVLSITFFVRKKHYFSSKVSHPT